MTGSKTTSTRLITKNLPNLGAVKPAQKLKTSTTKSNHFKLKPMTIENFKTQIDEIDEFIIDQMEHQSQDILHNFYEVQDYNFQTFSQFNNYVKTSNNTLANVPQLNANDLDRSSQNYSSQLIAAEPRSAFLYHNQFNQWQTELNLNFNILLFGIGSKTSLLNGFGKFMNQKGYHLMVLSGNHPSFNLKQLTNDWIRNILNIRSFPSQLKDQINFIREHHSVSQSKVVILFHNIDQVKKLNASQLNYLHQLTQLNDVHLIASVDRWDAQLNLNQFQYPKFNWLWHKTTNFNCYRREIKYLSIEKGQKNKLSIVGVQHVINSVSDKAKKMFAILTSPHNAEDEDEEDRTTNNQKVGMNYSDLFQLCKDKFLISNETQLNSLLKEFLDHGVIVQANDDRRGGVHHGWLKVPLTFEEIAKLDLS